jgi:MoaA/NifB/PqqE/SkfB family radical SAM enzyme
MTCSFCVTENGMDTMRYDQAAQLLDDLKQRGIDNIVLGGGEPFAWPHDTVALAATAKSHGFFVQIGTNGIAMPESYPSLACFDRYVLPLDSVDASVHNALRHHGPGHHALILDRLKALLSARKSVTVSTVVTSQNVHGLPELAELLANYQQRGGQLHGWHLYKFIPEGRGGRDNASWLDISPQVYDAACADVKRRALGLTVFKRKDMMHSKTVDFFWFEGGVLCAGSEVWGRRASPGLS